MWQDRLSVVFLILMATVSSRAQSPSPPRSLTKRSMEKWLKVLKVPSDCQREMYDSLSERKEVRLQFYRLGRREYVVEVNCFLGLYQPGQVFVYYNETNRKSPISRVLKLKTFEADDTTGRVSRRYECEVPGMATFDPKRKELEIFNRSRGPGGCGSLVVYGFRDGRVFVKRARAQPCDDKASPDPSTWKKVKKP
ncbi:MAG: DUF1176 domain-containing protein [Blastocatellia bacterium]